MTLPATPAQGGVSAADAPVPTYVGRWVSARIGTDFLTVVGARTHGREVRIAGAKSLTRIELTGALTAEQRDRSSRSPTAARSSATWRRGSR